MREQCWLEQRGHLFSWRSLKGHVTRDDSQRRFLAQHSVAMLGQCCNHSKQCRNNVATLCCAKNRRCESCVKWLEVDLARRALSRKNCSPRNWGLTQKKKNWDQGCTYSFRTESPPTSPDAEDEQCLKQCLWSSRLELHATEHTWLASPVQSEVQLERRTEKETQTRKVKFMHGYDFY